MRNNHAKQLPSESFDTKYLLLTKALAYIDIYVNQNLKDFVSNDFMRFNSKGEK